jgi:hypothetical protein
VSPRLDPPDQQWRIAPADPDDGRGSILAAYEAAPMGAHVPGETIRFSFPFLPSPDEGPDGHRTRYERVREYERVAGAYAAGLDIRRQPWYREQHGTELTALVRIDPPTQLESESVRGLYGLVESITDETSLPLTTYRIGFDVLYLAETDEYATRAAVENALAADGI